MATLTFPDTNGSALDSILTTEWTSVTGVLTDFNLLDLLS